MPKNSRLIRSPMRSFADLDMVEAATLVVDPVAPVMATLDTEILVMAVLAMEIPVMVAPVTLGTPVIPEILVTLGTLAIPEILVTAT